MYSEANELPTYKQRDSRRKEGNVYLTTHSTHFILRLYGVRNMVKDHLDSERGNLLPPHRLLFPINIKGSFIDRIAHTTAFVTPVVEHWLEQEIAQWFHPMKDRSADPSHNERTLLLRTYISLKEAAEASSCLLDLYSSQVCVDRIVTKYVVK